MNNDLGKRNFKVTILVNISEKKLINNYVDSILTAVKAKQINLQPKDVSVVVNDVPKLSFWNWNLLAILLVISSIYVQYNKLTSVNLPAPSFSQVSQVRELLLEPTPILSVTPTLAPAPTSTPVVLENIDTFRELNKTAKISILNATPVRNLAFSLKRTLNQDSFEFIKIGNASIKSNTVMILHKPGYEFEAAYLQKNFPGLMTASLSASIASSSARDITLVLGKDYLVN